MSFSTTPPRNDYIGTGALAAYAFGFKIFAATDLLVTKADTAGVETTLVYTTDFTIPAADINNPNGGTITLVAGNLTLNYLLTLRFKRTTQQSADLRNQGAFNLETIEDTFDQSVRMVQQIEDMVNRSLHLPETEVGTAAKTTLPSATDRASKFLAFDASGNPIASSGGLTSPPVTAFMTTVLDDTTAAAARATLGALGTSENAVGVVAGAITGAMLNDSVVNDLTTVIAASGDYVAIADVSDSNKKKKTLVSDIVSLPRSYLAGLGMSTAGSSATMSIAAGTCLDSTNAKNITVAAIAKTTSAWSVGTAAGGLDTGAIANSTWYHFWAILRSNTGVTDVLISLSATAPTMPANYDYKRRIGSGLTNGSAQWVKFSQVSDDFTWDVAILDVNVTNPGTAAVTRVLTVPTGVRVKAVMNAQAKSVTTAGLNCLLSDLAITDAAASLTVAPLGNMGYGGNLTGGPFAQLGIWTDTSASIRSRFSASAGSDALVIATTGWIDRRGRDD
jgi:hypothetical protein